MGLPADTQKMYGYGASREVVIDRPFAVGRFVVTVAQWKWFSKQNDARSTWMKDYAWMVKGRDGDPARNVSFEAANIYAQWLSSLTGKPYRLISEAQWEYCSYTNLGMDTSTEVGTDWGLREIYEKQWCADIWHDDYNRRT